MDATSNIPLKVPFNEKDQAKALGARWNAEAKHWYIPQGVDAAPFEKWLTNASMPVASQPAIKPKSKSNTDVPQNQSFEDDLDAINARLRDAYESYDSDVF